ADGARPVAERLFKLHRCLDQTCREIENHRRPRRDYYASRIDSSLHKSRVNATSRVGAPPAFFRRATEPNDSCVAALPFAARNDALASRTNAPVKTARRARGTFLPGSNGS